MRRLLTGVVLGGLLAGVSQGADVRFRGGGSWDWLEGIGQANGWQQDHAPDATDTVRANWGGAAITLNYETTVGAFQAGVDESGTFHIQSGGILNAGNSKIGNNNNCTGTMIIDSGGTVNANGGWLMIAGNSTVTGIANVSGSLNATGHLWMATGAGATGTLNIDNGGIVDVGGNVGLGTVNAADPSGGNATIHVNLGGMLNLDRWSNTNSIQPGSVLNINEGGIVTVGGNRVTAAENYFAIGKIASDLGAIQATFDGGANLTTIIAIPEPSTLGLLGMVGALGFLRRRRP